MSANELVIVAGSGDVEEVKRIMSAEQAHGAKLSVNSMNTKGETALMEAAYKGDVSMCELLMNLGADVTIKDLEFQNTVRVCKALQAFFFLSMFLFNFTFLVVVVFFFFSRCTVFRVLNLTGRAGIALGCHCRSIRHRSVFTRTRFTGSTQP